MVGWVVRINDRQNPDRVFDVLVEGHNAQVQIM